MDAWGERRGQGMFGWLRRIWEQVELLLWTHPAAVPGLPDSREMQVVVDALVERDRRLAGKARVQARKAARRACPH